MSKSESNNSLAKFREGAFRVLPLVGAASSVGFSAYLMNPNVLQRLFPQHSVAAANSLWFDAHLGMGVYIYNSSHLSTFPVHRRVSYALFSTVIFNFGSALLVATAKALLPENATLQAVSGAAIQIFLILTGKAYLDQVDRVEK